MNQDWLLFKRVFNPEYRYVLATIINTEGSTYRKSGAMMLLTEQTSFGLLSGGCLEEDIRLHGLECLANLQQKVIRYDLRNESDELWGLGLGCEGAIDILLQPLTPENNHLNFADLLEFISQQNLGLLRFSPYSKTVKPLRIETDINRLDKLSSQQCELIKSGKSIRVASFKHSSTDHRNNSKRSENHVSQGNASKTSDNDNQPNENQDLLIPVRSPINLLICGAGPDVLPFINLVKELGWQLYIWDHRKGYLNQSCFNTIDKQLIKPHSISASFMDKMDAVVIMSHHLEYDKHYLIAALKSNLDYIGLLGPVKRKLKLLDSINEVEDLECDIESNIESKYDRRLFGPVGLDINANSPASIALSVVAQLQQHFYSKQPFMGLFDKALPEKESSKKELPEEELFEKEPPDKESLGKELYDKKLAESTRHLSKTCNTQEVDE